MLFELVTDQVPQPIYLTHAGDERLFVVGRAGTIHVLQGGALLATPFLDIADDVLVSGEGGMLSIAFHPDYASNGWLFVTYTRRGPNAATPLVSVIERFSVSADPNTADPASRRLVLEVDQPFTNHNGGQIEFGPDGYLYVALGDGGSSYDPACRAQNGTDLLGKLLRLDVDAWSDAERYRIPADNPFVGARDPNGETRDEIWALGLRNPWRFSFDRERGDLWIADVGQGQREEIDFAPASSAGGENYGWKMLEGSVCHGQEVPAECPATTPRCDDPAYTSPVFEYGRDDGRAITGGYVYRGMATPDFRGRYVYGDSQTGRVWALEGPPGRYAAELLSDGELAAPVSFGEDAAGELYVVDLGRGNVFRLRLGGALPQTRAQRRCLVGMNQGTAGVAAAQAAVVRDCVSRAARGLPDATPLESCFAADRGRRVARGAARLAKLDADRCAVPPSFGFTGADVSGAAATWSELELVRDLFGEFMDEAIARSDRAGRDVARCQGSVLAGVGDCQRARRKAFLDCKQRGLGDATLRSAEQLALCLDADRKGRVARACDPATGKLARGRIPKHCARAEVDLAVAFPGCVSGASDELASCLDALGRCRHCQLLEGADDLELACDLYDDGQSNASCAPVE